MISRLFVVNCQIFQQQQQQQPLLPEWTVQSPMVKSPLSNNDNFVVQMCRERVHRLDYKKMLEPCAQSLNFGTHIYDSTLRTNPTFTAVIDKDIREAGEYSSFKIKTYDNSNRVKTFGGDSFRVFINGTLGSMEASVYDLGNGEYETSFLLLNPGVYLVKVIMEGSMCSSYVNPPKDWFRKGIKCSSTFSLFRFRKAKCIA